MSTPKEVLSWNVADGLNDPQIRQVILDREPDIAVFPEAAKENDLAVETTRAFINAGYGLAWTNYDDDDGRKDRHGLVAIVKPELVSTADIVRAAGRNAIQLGLRDGTSFLGVHLDDRDEIRRATQAKALLASDRQDGVVLAPNAIVAGDFNAMHRKDARARSLRAAAPMARLLPSKDPDEKYSKVERVGSLSQRLTAMADGGTMKVFTDSGFMDADPMRQPTMKKGPVAVQIDRIMYRGDIELINETVVESVDGLSDHRLISALLQ